MEKLVRHDSTGKVYQLTDEGRLAYECWIRLLSHTAERCLDLKVSAKHNPVRYAGRLSLGDHACFLYEDEVVRRMVLSSFLGMGLLKDLAVVYVTCEERINHEAKEIRTSGIDVERLEKKGAFTMMSAEEWYLRRGKASPNAIIDNWLNLLREKMKEGYKGVQAAEETTVFLSNAKASQLLSYENKLRNHFPKNLCALCMVDARRLQPEQAISLIKAHRHGVFNGIAFPLQ
jgi:hypothetical protein